jgi:hypothetical protein
MGDLEVAVCAGGLGMNDTLGDSLTIKVREEIDMVEILEQERAVDACALGGVGLVDGGAV